MIKFFGRIRRQLLTDYKFGKYLLYAIGEIVLVVIGILIALQINNWNEERKSLQEINNYLEVVIGDLEYDNVYYDRLLASLATKITFLESAISNNEDTLVLKRVPAMVSMNMDVRSFGHAFIDLKQKGKLNQIQDPELIASLRRYYETSTFGHNAFSEWHKNFVTLNVESFLVQKITVYPDDTANAKEVLEALKENELPRIISYQIRNYKNARNNLQRYKDQSMQLIKDIKDHIAKN